MVACGSGTLENKIFHLCCVKYFRSYRILRCRCVSPWMQAELQRTEEEEAEHKAKQKEKAKTRSDDLAAVFSTSDKSTSSVSADAKAPAAKDNTKTSKPIGKAGVSEKSGK